jgi:hypothetical protein
MNYQRHYDQLIANAKKRDDVSGYTEKHHILPKSLGGSNAKNNIVTLTGREHFLAHMLLAKIHGKGLWQAARMMQNKSKVQGGRRSNSRLYEMAKREWAAYRKGQPRPQHVGEAIREARTGSKASAEARAKMSAARLGKPRSGDPAKWKHSEESKDKMRQSHIRANTGARLPRMYGDDNPMRRPENRAKISAAKTAYWARIREQKSLSGE